ncbi:hypothetical protein [Bradyrhizobium sp. USDA 4520]
MSLVSDVDTTASAFVAALAAYANGGGDAARAAQWTISQIKQSHPGIARALDQGVARYVAEQPDRRSFASIG